MTPRLVTLDREDDFEGWRNAARSLAASAVPAHKVVWQVGDQRTDLFAGAPVDLATTRPIMVPGDFVRIARCALLHSEPQRFALLYDLFLKVLDRPSLVRDRTDGLVHKVGALSQAVLRDIHKMQGFVRFREVQEEGVCRYVAWFEPDHHILRASAAFFVNRFAAMTWSILTPKGSLHWDGGRLLEGPPARRQDGPDADTVEAVWKTYYAATFNPARLGTRAMMREMPGRYWRNLPETSVIRDLVSGSAPKSGR